MWKFYGICFLLFLMMTEMFLLFLLQRRECGRHDWQKKKRSGDKIGGRLAELKKEWRRIR